MEHSCDEFIFDTGKTIYANDCIIGINPNGNLFQGYDGYINENLTKQEKIELADYMINKWKEFRDNPNLKDDKEED